MTYRFFSLVFVLSLIVSGCPSGDSTHHGPVIKVNLTEIEHKPETCGRIPDDQKMNPFRISHRQNFYFFTENSKRYSIRDTQAVYVIGDIHGSWQMILNAALNSGVMEFATPQIKTVQIKHNGKIISVDIPNLKLAGSPNKLIFVGDYIAKSSPKNEQTTLALLNDILMTQKAAGADSIVAVLGNHDLEAVNDVNHHGYPSEKNYREQILEMIQNGLFKAAYYYNGIWYSHSYLTQDDYTNLSSVGVSLDQITRTDNLDTALLPRVNQTNDYILDLIKGERVGGTWLASAQEGKGGNFGPFNFFYTMNSDPQKTDFPIIMGHLSDLHRKEVRVLTEGYGGKLNTENGKMKSHILCVDTSIYHSYSSGERATYLKIEYGALRQDVDFQTCSIPTR